MKKFIAVALVAAVFTASVFAQALPSLILSDEAPWESPQSESTAGLFPSDADNFIRPDSFSDVEFDKWFGFVSYKDDKRANIGFATRFGENKDGAYLGLFYSGSLWANIDKPGYSTKTATWSGVPDTGGVKIYDSLPSFFDPTDLDNPYPNSTPYNQLAVLIGLENFGIRFSLITSYERFKAEDFIILVDDTDPLNLVYDQYKSFKTAQGAWIPEIAFSLTESLLDNGVKPWASLSIGFYRNYSRSQLYDEVGGVWRTLGEEIDYSINHTDISFSLGLGGYTLSEKNGWSTSVDFEYGLYVPIYRNEYSRVNPNDPNSTIIEKIKGASVGGFLLQEMKEHVHVLQPSIGTEWSGEKLTLKANLGLGFGLGFHELTGKGINNNALVTSGQVEEIFEFTFYPNIQLALQWKLNEKFALNFGGSLEAPLVRTKRKGESYLNGVPVPFSSFESVDVKFAEDGINNKLAIGATFDSGDNVFFEISTGIGNGNDGNEINVFKTDGGGLFHFYNLLVGLRF